MPVDPNAAVAAQNAQIQAIYDALGKNLQGHVGATQQIFGQAQQGTQGAYDQGLGDLKSITDRLSQRIQNSANKLGLGVAVPQATLGLEGTLANQGSRMVGNRTAALDALTGTGAAYSAVAQRAVGDSQRVGAQNKVDSANKLRNALYRYMGEEEGARGKVELQKLQNQSDLSRQQSETQMRKLALDAQIKQAQVHSQSQQNAANAAAAERAAERQYRAQASANDPMAELKARYMGSQIDNLDARTRELIMGKQKSGDFGTGIQGLNEYMDEAGLDDNAASAIDHLIQVGQQNSYLQGTKGNPVSAYDSAMNAFYTEPPPGVDPNQIATALQIYWGKTKRGR